MLNKASDWGMFSGANPVSKVRFYKEGEKVRPLTEAEVSRVLDTARSISAAKDASPMGREFYPLAVFILNTGLRRSEALGLRWSEVRDDAVRVRGKGGRVREVPLNADALAVLRDRRRDGSFVFDVPNRDRAGVLRRMTETVTRRTKVPFHIHLLRHVFASRLLAAGVDIVTVGDLLGHSAIMTSMLYTHSSSEQKRKAVNRLATKIVTEQRTKKRK